ncbi:MAG: VCBS repeat-containing protein [Treponema sp.]|jgi:hypothetical protein|nr:VCBS repeat-containing protein [Treponema sp.]
MGKEKKKKEKTKLKRIAGVFAALFLILAGLSLLCIGLSFFGRVEPGSLIPDSFILRAQIPNPLDFAETLSKHKPLPEILNLPGLAPAAPVLNALGTSPFLKNPVVRFAARGKLEAALFTGEYPAAERQNGGPAGQAGAANPALIVVWDTGFFSPLLRFLPLVSRFIDIPNLYAVQSGKNSRFEYRAPGRTFFIGRRRNLLVACDRQAVFEAAVGGGTGNGAGPGPFGNGGSYDAGGGNYDNGGYDAALLLSPAYLRSVLAEQNPGIAAVLENVEVSGSIKLELSVAAERLEFRLGAPVLSRSPVLGRILEKQSVVPGLAELLPASTQYGTILSAGSPEELCAAAALFLGPEFESALRRAGNSSRFLLGLSLEELLYSWTGGEFAVFALEGRPSQIYAVQIADEGKRRDIFARAFRTIVLNENISMNLDGTRIPRIELPDFLRPLLRFWDFRVPSPYYAVHGDYLFISESAETLLALIRSIQKNDVLPKTALWRNLAGSGAPVPKGSGGGGGRLRSDASALSLFYSLDRSLPFFLKGNTLLSSVLGLYRQGLARIGFENGFFNFSLSMIPGGGGGLVPVPGYPLELAGNPGNRVYAALSGKVFENRILFSGDDYAVAVNPGDNSIHEYEGPGALWVIPAAGVEAKTGSGIAWVVSVQGRVSLVNGGMEALRGFPVLTGLRLSAPPAARGGKLFLCDEEGRVYTVDTSGLVTPWKTTFSAALRSPPSFLDAPAESGKPAGRAAAGQGGGNGKTGRAPEAAVYPKSFFGEIWLLDSEGEALPGWPATVPGIAFGSPLLFTHNGRVFAAFVTQAGELSVFGESAVPLAPFPLELEGVFFVQPVFDGGFLWLVSAGGELFRISLEGDLLRQSVPGLAVREEGYIAAFDSDGDGIPEIFISGEGNALYGYTRNFASLSGFPLPVWGRPAFADFNGDGKPEIAGLGMDKKLYRWQFR